MNVKWKQGNAKYDNANFFIITNQKSSNYSVTLLINSNAPKSNVILKSWKYVTVTKQGIL